jgi:hypothetical protein
VVLAEASHAGIKAVGAEGQMQSIFPLQVHFHLLCGPAVEKVVERLKDDDEGEQDRREGRLTSLWYKSAQFGRVLVGEHVADDLVGVVISEMLGTPRGYLRRQCRDMRAIASMTRG